MPWLTDVLQGQDVVITTTSGERLAGVYSGAESSGLDNHTLKMARRTRQVAHIQVNGTPNAEFTGTGPNHELIVAGGDVASIECANIKLATGPASQQNGSSPQGVTTAVAQTDRCVGFATDTQISGQNSQTFRERELKRWEAPSATDVDLSLGKSSVGEWDQFEANQKKFGVQSTYDELIYTTRIDESRPDHAHQLRNADRIAAEIESGQRGREIPPKDDGGDEEDKYSSVKRDLPRRTAGAYVPPSQRPISGVPTVSGAPFDPAIISSEIKVKSPAGTSAVPPPAAAPVAPVSQTPSTNAPAEVAGPTNQAENPIRATSDAFKQFANTEKLRIRQAQEAQRNNKRQEKNVKLNDLKKFAANFKLKSRVPDDLVPILAKDRDKQVEIQTKAEQAAKEAELRSKDRDADKASSVASSGLPSTMLQTISSPSTQQPPFNIQAQRKGGQQQLHGPQPGQGASPRGPPNGQYQNRQWPRPQPLPPNLRMPSGPQAPTTETPLSPASTTSSRALNVKAQEFVFRPAAHTFAPSGPSPSRQHTTSGVGPTSTPSSQPVPSFFDSKKTRETVPLNTFNDGITFLVSNDYTEEQKKKFVFNGGIPQSYCTQPTWNTTEANANVTHEAAFPRLQPASQGPSPMQTPLPHQMPHQLPQHVMPVQAMPAPNHRQPFYPPQGGHMPGYPGPNMHGQFQQHNSAQNSPRMQHMGSFNGQVPPMPPFHNQGVPGYGSPNPAFRQPMQPGMPHPQGQSKSRFSLRQPRPLTGSKVMRGPPHQGFPPQYPPPPMGGHMMMPNPSAGGYNGGPAPGYSPMLHPAQPQMQFPPHHNQGQFGGGSPRGYPMSQQGSQQGYNMPGPHPMHFQRAMSGGYPPHMTPRQQAAMPHHGSPGMGPVQDEGK